MILTQKKIIVSEYLRINSNSDKLGRLKCNENFSKFKKLKDINQVNITHLYL